MGVSKVSVLYIYIDYYYYYFKYVIKYTTNKSIYIRVWEERERGGGGVSRNQEEQGKEEK